MCQCTPEIRTPFCGKPGCEWPAPQPVTIPEKFRDPKLAAACGQLAMEMERTRPSLFEMEEDLEAGMSMADLTRRSIEIAEHLAALQSAINLWFSAWSGDQFRSTEDEP